MPLRAAHTGLAGKGESVTSAASRAATAPADTAVTDLPAHDQPGASPALLAGEAAADQPAAGQPAADVPAAEAEQPPAPGPEVRWRRAYRGDEAQIAALRRWLAVLLPACDTRDDVVTVAVELATNAVRHTASGHDGWFIVEVVRDPGIVRIAVADQGAASGPRMDDDIDPLSESGHGLQMVRALSVSVGVAGNQRGRAVSADVAWPDASGPGAGAPGLPAG